MRVPPLTGLRVLVGLSLSRYEHHLTFGNATEHYFVVWRACVGGWGGVVAVLEIELSRMFSIHSFALKFGPEVRVSLLKKV